MNNIEKEIKIPTQKITQILVFKLFRYYTCKIGIHNPEIITAIFVT